MTRDHAISYLKGMAQRERVLSLAPMPYLAKSDRERARAHHKQTADALDIVLSELDTFIAVPRADPCRVYQQNDEYVCSACGIRWDINEERPPCLG